MAIRPFNSLQGYSVGDDPKIDVISANGDVTAANLTVNSISNLGPVSNIVITGGTSGQAIVTDGFGNLSFASTSSNLAAPMPFNIPDGEAYTVSTNFQGLFATPITIDGELEIDGILIDVGQPIDSEDTQVFFDSDGVPTGNAGFTFSKVSGNLSVPGNIIASGNLVPTGNLIYSLGTDEHRWNDLYLSGNTIYLGNSTLSQSNTGNLVLTNSTGGELVIAGNTTVSILENGNSNIAINANANIAISVDGISNVVVISSNIATIAGNVVTTGILTDNYYYANGQSLDVGGNPAGSNTQVQFNNSSEFGASANFTFNSSTSVLTVTGNLVASNGNLGNLVSANYLVSDSGCIILSSGAIAVIGNAAGIFSSTITDINFGLAANITMGSTTGLVTARGDLTATGNITTNQTVTANNVQVGDLYSKRAPIQVTTDTVVDIFPLAEYRSAKYTIKAGSDLGYQALEVLLIHDDINSIITIYGSLSTAGNAEIVIMSTVIDSGNVKLLASGLGANTSLNLMGTYVPD